MNWKLKKSDMVQEAAQTGGKNVILEILMFVGVFIGVSIIQYIPTLVAGFMLYVTYDQLMMVHLFGTVIMTLMTMLFCKVIQKRKMCTLGFKKPGMWKEYGIGLVVGFVMMAVIVLVGVVTGSMTLTFNPEAATGAGIGMLVLLFFGFVLQGMSEEVLCRGYFLVSLARKKGYMWMAVIVNAVAFAALHLGNAGIAPLAFVNLILFGIFASVYFVKRGNIWGIAAIHSIWNFAQGNIFGVLVSGNDFGTTIFKSEINESMTLINGGDFGLEGGILVTIVMIVGTLMMLITKQKDVAEEV
ncbi:MAG: CPBP family intramembrane metalloprotease [Lachnospiraceae bacterium]|nr:CPBP family intramembrane metalloprotease [Lachnospiraceae bacterium]